MFSFTFFTAMVFGGLSTLSTAKPVAQQAAPFSNGSTANLAAGQITPNLDVPAGYQVGFATQDMEPAGQQSACTINGGVCSAPTPLYPSTSGPDNLPAGVWAAAVVGLGPDDCSVCGTCYSLISSGTPYCDPSSSSCAVPSGPEVQTGPSEIKVLIVNHCPNCSMMNVNGQVQGHFDINNMNAGWNNPKIYYKQLDNSECT
ncbi:hypothetical protein BDR22DRAFT_891060 [Usnea florida]